MPERADHLEDIRARLADMIDGVGDHVYRSRVVTLSTNMLPAVCLYAPEEDSGDAIAAGGHAQYRPTHTLCIEIRVGHGDGFDLAAGKVVKRIKDLLFRDPDWTGRFKPHPRWSVKQFLDRRGDEVFCGEVLTITVTDKRPTDYPPTAPQLTGISASADMDGDGVGDIHSRADAAP